MARPDETPMTPTPPDLAAIISALTTALNRIAEGQEDAKVVATEALEKARKQVQPDNKTAPGISVFNPQGDKDYARPSLKCKMFLPWQAEEVSLTWEEIELLNLLEPGEFAIRRNDGTKVRVTVQMTKTIDGKPDRLMLNAETGFDNLNHKLMPPLTDLLRQILKLGSSRQAKAAEKILTMEARETLVREGQLPISVGA